MFESKCLKKILGVKQLPKQGRILRTDELRNLYKSSKIVRIVMGLSLRYAGYVPRMGELGMHKEFWWGKRLGRRSNLRRPRRIWEEI
jgi:hypothetical protein